MLNRDLLEEQKAYYRARAAEYDQWFLRQGRYDRGEEWNRHWFAEVAEVQKALTNFDPHGDILEIAAGTGWWTEELLRGATRLTAIDASAETLRLNERRLGGNDQVEYVEADIFAWRPERGYDVVFFSFWLSHVPREGFEGFWELVASALKPGGRVFFVDSLRTETSTAIDHKLPELDEPISVRKLNDGSEFRVVKIFYSPGELRERLQRLGWESDINQTTNFFVYGSALRALRRR